MVVIAVAFVTITVAFTTTAFITATSGTFIVVGFIKTSVIIGKITVVSLVNFASTFRTTVSQTYSDYSVTFNFTSLALAAYCCSDIMVIKIIAVKEKAAVNSMRIVISS